MIGILQLDLFSDIGRFILQFFNGVIFLGPVIKLLLDLLM